MAKEPWLLVALGLLLFVPSLGLRDLWNPDEPRYAEVAREMRETGVYLVPHLNGEAYAEKPPLFFWLSAALQGPAGFMAGRIVAAVAAIGAMLLTFLLARLWFPARTALLAACVLATTELFGWLGHFGGLDIPLTFCTTLAVYGVCRGGRATALFWIGMGLGVLTKGPVALMIPVLAAIALRPPGWRHAVWGVPLTLAMIAAWLIPACVAGGAEYTDTILFKQNLGRLQGSWSHQRPWWYYFQYVAVGFFPWVLFVPGAVSWTWRKGEKDRGLLLWFLLGFLAFSIISGKRERYLLPLFPPLAILVARYIHAPPAERWLRRFAGIGNGVVIGAGVGFLALGVAGTGILDRWAEVAAAMRPVARAAWLLAGTLLCLVGWLGFRRRSVAGVVAGMAALFLMIDLVLVPRINEIKSSRPVAERLNAERPEAVAVYPALFGGGYNLYSGRLHFDVLTKPEDVNAFLAAGGRRLVLTDRPVDGLTATHRKIDVRRVGNRRMVFLVNYE